MQRYLLRGGSWEHLKSREEGGGRGRETGRWEGGEERKYEPTGRIYLTSGVYRVCAVARNEIKRTARGTIRDSRSTCTPTTWPTRWECGITPQPSLHTHTHTPIMYYRESIGEAQNGVNPRVFIDAFCVRHFSVVKFTRTFWNHWFNMRSWAVSPSRTHTWFSSWTVSGGRCFI